MKALLGDKDAMDMFNVGTRNQNVDIYVVQRTTIAQEKPSGSNAYEGIAGPHVGLAKLAAGPNVRRGRSFGGGPIIGSNVENEGDQPEEESESKESALSVKFSDSDEEYEGDDGLIKFSLDEEDAKDTRAREVQKNRKNNR